MPWTLSLITNEAMHDNNVLEVKNLVTQFHHSGEILTAVNNVSFNVPRGKSLGIVGESGSGKSLTALSIMRLTPSSRGCVSHGEVLLEGEDLMKLSDSEMRLIRGNKISMIFQDPMTSLNPAYTVGNQISEVLMLHKDMTPRDARDKSIELLGSVGVSSPEMRVSDYPHLLSGGMCQRVMIAMALACEPNILIADEPTTALDVTIQSQILDLMKHLQEEIGMSIILITHDLGIVAEVCDNIAVMYCGKIVEFSDTQSIFCSPKHPYTQGLLESIPSMESAHTSNRLKTIKGAVPSLDSLPLGCSFQDRCNFADDECKGKNGPPELNEKSKDHLAACFHPLNNDKRE
jgi:oligopeptide/dipeptide ABC transporter ATP-binding protein